MRFVIGLLIQWHKAIRTSHLLELIEWKYVKSCLNASCKGILSKSIAITIHSQNAATVNSYIQLSIAFPMKVGCSRLLNMGAAAYEFGRLPQVSTCNLLLSCCIKSCKCRLPHDHASYIRIAETFDEYTGLK